VDHPEPFVEYIVVRADGPLHGPSRNNFSTLKEAREEAAYWRHWVPDRPRIVYKAVTTYTPMEDK
jgi:hypothetical protein